jgi:tetratricopeptide (TPR) repeat protein
VEQEVATFEKAFAVEPEQETDDIQNHQYGWALMRIGEEARVRAVFDKMVAQGGTKAARGRRSLAILALEHGRIDEASRELLEAARMNEAADNRLSAARDRYYLADALTLVSRRGAAAGEIRRAEDLLKKDGHTQAWLGLRLAVLWARVEQPAEARRLIQILRPKIENDSSARSDLLRAEGELLLAERSNGEGIEKLRQARSVQSSYLTKSSLAGGVARASLLTEAIALHEPLIAEGPEAWEGHVDWAVAHERLARLYELAGDVGKARATYLRLIEIWKDADNDLEPRRRAHQALRRIPVATSSKVTRDTHTSGAPRGSGHSSAASLRPRRHRPTLEKPIQIVGQRPCADVAALRFLTQRFEHDCIEVARQARGQCASGHPPRVSDVVDRWGVIMIPGDDHVRRSLRFGLERCAFNPLLADANGLRAVSSSKRITPSA